MYVMHTAYNEFSDVDVLIPDATTKFPPFSANLQSYDKISEL